MSNQHLTR